MNIKRLFSMIVTLLLCGGAGLADTIVLRDGASHDGKLVSVTSTTITFRENGVLHHYARSNVESLNMDGNGSGYGNPQLAERSTTPTRYGRNVTLPAGTEIAVMTDQNINSSDAHEGQTYQADIANNVTDESGHVAIPKGSPAELILRNVSGSLTGTHEMALDLQSVKVGDRRYTINSNDVVEKGKEGIGANRRTAEMTGGGAALGTLIGAIAGGGKGAAIGALGGAAAGAGTQILTRGKSVKIPAETTLRFRLDEPLHLSAAY